MTTSIIIKEATTTDIPVIASLARQIWPDAYGAILSAVQLEYMLDLIYSHPALQQQMEEQQQCFLIARIEDQPVGFAAFSKIAEPGTFKLHKLYVRTDIQGKGLGKALLDAVQERIKALHATTLHLNVNRHNKAKLFYEKNGFYVIKEDDIDIGNGYFMNDYIMEKKM
jgi:ribosomal protein S18 acetylase RimI-like enzyme